MKRRTFIPQFMLSTIGAAVSGSVFSHSTPTPQLPPPSVHTDDFWEQVRAQYRTGEVINLNNGGVSPHPLPVEEAFFNYHRVCNEVPSLTMWRSLKDRRIQTRAMLAQIAGCSAEEIATNRNATEALVTIIMQLPLKKGDEVVLSKFDYPRMMNAWKIREERDGVVLKWVNPEEGNPSDLEIVQRYVSQFSSKTKAVHITHMINWTGRLIPAQPIIAEAQKKNITTLVDAAHTFAHVPFSISDLGCDYLGASLHKWLGAPFGNGMLYVRKEKIEETLSFFPTEKSIKSKIEKFEELGTRNNAAEFAISSAIDFYTFIGAQRKFDRLVELRNYWIDQVKAHPNIKVHTPLQPGRSGAIGLVQILNDTPMDDFLIDKYKIHCVCVDHEGIHGVRITPNVYTSKQELDVLVKGLLEAADIK